MVIKSENLTRKDIQIKINSKIKQILIQYKPIQVIKKSYKHKQ